jgi:diaminopimelate decarboxylase
VIEKYFVRSGLFAADGVGIGEIVSRYDTPLYLYSAGVIAEKYENLTSSFDGFDVFYSLKANPGLAICAELAGKGAGADISSLGELETALKAGIEPGDIVFVGPGKTERDIGAAIRAGIYAIVAESRQELELIESVSRKMSRSADVLLRINTLEEPASPEMMVGGPSKFGFDEETVTEQVRTMELRGVRLIGIHVYSASQVLDSGFISRHLAYVAGLAVRISTELGFDLRCVDFGGGFGVPYEAGEVEIDLGRISVSARDVRRQMEDLAPGCRLVLEVGRYLVAEAGIFVTRIIRVKDSRGACFVITDGGMNHFSRPVFMHVNHAVRVLNKIALKGDTRCSIGGPICTPLDIMGRDILLPRPDAGDILGIFNAGAYGYTMSMMNFMSLGLPAEVMADSGNLHLVRKPRPATFLLEDQMIPD